MCVILDEGSVGFGEKDKAGQRRGRPWGREVHHVGYWTGRGAGVARGGGVGDREISVSRHENKGRTKIYLSHGYQGLAEHGIV